MKKLFLALAFVLWSMLAVSAQTSDLRFSIERVELCPLNPTEFQITATVGHIADLKIFPNRGEIPLAIDVIGPRTQAPRDEHPLEYFYPDNPHQGCSTLMPPNCVTGTCPKWVVKSKDKLYEFQPVCRVAGPMTCRCAANSTIDKKEEKHDGPGSYTVIVTIDPFDQFPESHPKGENVMQAVLLEGAPPCPIGACCLLDGNCQDGLTRFDCGEMGGTPTKATI